MSFSDFILNIRILFYDFNLLIVNIIKQIIYEQYYIIDLIFQ